MAKLADAHGLGPCGEILGGSSPLPPTRLFSYFRWGIGFEGSERRAKRGKASATIVVRSVSERVADPEPTIGGEGRQVLFRPPVNTGRGG